jgi:hypothetical protein
MGWGLGSRPAFQETLDSSQGECGGAGGQGIWALDRIRGSWDRLLHAARESAELKRGVKEVE